MKITFTADAELKVALNDCAEIYRQAYGQKEIVSYLIPFMHASFMEIDAGFRRARKQLAEQQSQSFPNQS
ncbi:DUF2274 domain-containing protein [Roseibium album]|uniref:DUF2274 domain-containing protein n=1 Tax=Roseibium album TaxID=311410 RepID=UPI0006DC2A95|nr:DUF2274 domain-containing protein [Roseibium album]